MDPASLKAGTTRNSHMKTHPCDPSSRAQASLAVDVIIIGAGLCGTLASLLLSRTHCRLALIDFYDVYPVDFRSEQLVGEQVERLKKLSLLDVVAHNSIPLGRAMACRAGKTINIVEAPHYGMRYDTMVNNARARVPSSVQFIKGQVLDINLATELQRVTLTNGQIIEGRLVIMATGLGQRLLSQLGITKTVIHPAQSLAFGFDVKIERPALSQPSYLVAYGEKTSGAIDYITFFPVGNVLRANLFTYTNPKDIWVKEFIQSPIDTLREALPHLEQMTGKIIGAGSVDFRVNDVTVASDFIREGLVVIGDAFQTTSPASGTGVTRLLNDIDRLCNVYVPKWLETKSIPRTAVREFYQDPIKRKCDAECLRITHYRRAYVLATGMRWKIHRKRVALQSGLRLWMQSKKTQLHSLS